MRRGEAGIAQQMARISGGLAALEAAIEAAYPELRRRTHLYAWKSGVARTRDEAAIIGDDILHESLERVLDKADAYDPARSVHAWVMKFVTNVILERKRAWWNDAAHIASEPEVPRGESESLLSRLEMIQDITTEGHHRLQEILTLVGPMDQQVLELRYIYGMSFRELGAAMGISENAARVRHHRVISRLTDAYFAADQAGSEER